MKNYLNLPDRIVVKIYLEDGSKREIKVSAKELDKSTFDIIIDALKNERLKHKDLTF